jgi:hypothetical protein
MSRRQSDFAKLISLLTELHKSYPYYGAGRHLATILADYGDIWGMTDKEMVFALEKYKLQLEMDVPHAGDSDIDEIIKQGMNLDTILKEEDNNGEEY